MSFHKRFMLLGSGELGREIVIAAKRLGCFCSQQNQNRATNCANKAKIVSKSFKKLINKNIVQEYT